MRTAIIVINIISSIITITIIIIIVTGTLITDVVIVIIGRNFGSSNLFMIRQRV